MMRCLAVLCVMMFSLQASADSKYSPEYSVCIEKAEGITFDMNECNNKELAKQNKHLNESYAATMGVLSAESKTQLRDAQRLWIKYRDANCFMYYNLSGGTMDQINGAGCMLSMTVDRAAEIKWFAEFGGE